MVKLNISCIIPTHNRDNFLKEGVYSAINQTFPPVEIIVSDNVPSKKTQSLIEEIAETSSVPIHYIGHKLLGRSSISMNLAASKAKGDFIAFLNDDDAWEKDYLEKISYLKFKKNSKIIYTWLIDWYFEKKNQGKKIKPNLLPKDFLLKNPGCVISNLVVEKDIFLGLGGFDEYIHPTNDKDFIIRALYFGFNYDVLEESLVLLRRHNEKRVTDIDKEFLNGVNKFFKKHEFIASPKIKVMFWFKYWFLYFRHMVWMS